MAGPGRRSGGGVEGCGQVGCEAGDVGVGECCEEFLGELLRLLLPVEGQVPYARVGVRGGEALHAEGEGDEDAGVFVSGEGGDVGLGLVCGVPFGGGESDRVAVEVDGGAEVREVVEGVPQLGPVDGRDRVAGGVERVHRSPSSSAYGSAMSPRTSSMASSAVSRSTPRRSMTEACTSRALASSKVRTSAIWPARFPYSRANRLASSGVFVASTAPAVMGVGWIVPNIFSASTSPDSVTSTTWACFQASGAVCRSIGLTMMRAMICSLDVPASLQSSRAAASAVMRSMSCWRLLAITPPASRQGRRGSCPRRDP